ncbi:MAG TPA: hypothetical protein VE377_25705 [Candidatus Dormibacteraeota bacterium]|nr:hypothetical protein [Terriglobales bacterium]HYM79399.1 hypothetical protein [Candidatus Dormibacteraeota bacterium]
MCDRLFSLGDASDRAYVNLRDMREEWIVPAREFVESLWDHFRGFADPHFLTEVRRDFHARFWEMYLTCALQEYAAQRGAVLSCPKPGPDILLEHEGNRVWVEAVVATNGVPGLPDTVVEPNPDGSGKIPEEKLVLRYTNAIAEKYRKYRGYLREGIIHKNDAFVIAINGAALSYKWTQAERDAPRFLKAVYPLGAYQLLLDRRTGEIVGQQNEPRFSIVKASGANVATMPFLERRSRGISAILGSFADPMYHRTQLGSDFELAHNPMSRAPIADFVIPAKKAWRAVLNESGGELNGHILA